MSAYTLLRLSLLALAALYAFWFAPLRDWAALTVFVLPPLSLTILCHGLRAPRVAFWAAVLALLWFSHGVMAAWTQPTARGYAWGEILLALCVIFAASAPGFRARYAKKSARKPHV